MVAVERLEVRVPLHRILETAAQLDKDHVHTFGALVVIALDMLVLYALGTTSADPEYV